MIASRPHVTSLLFAGLFALARFSAAADEAPLEPIAEGYRALKSGDYSKAERCFREAVVEFDFESEATGWIDTQLKLSHLLTLQGKHSDAIDLLHQVSGICDGQLGPADPLTIDAYHRLAATLRQGKRFTESEAIYRRNLAHLEARYGRRHLFVAQEASRLAAVLLLEEKKAEAGKLHDRAMEIVCTSTEGDGPQTCIILTNYAEYLLADHRREEAIATMDRAFAIANATDDCQLASVGSVLRKQAEFYRTVHLLDRAETLGRRAVSRLATRGEWDRSKFYYYGTVKTTYSAILRDRGLDEGEIFAQIRSLESGATN